MAFGDTEKVLEQYLSPSGDIRPVTMSGNGVEDWYDLPRSSQAIRHR
jgi:hypothetical protein